MRELIFEAFGLTYYPEQAQGPAWIDTETYDIAAKVPPGASKEQFRTMLRKLLAERFKLAVHHESITLPVYRLMVAKTGPKMKASEPAELGETAAPGPPDHDPEGFPVIPPGHQGLFATRTGSPGVAHTRVRGQQQTMEALAKMLSAPNEAGRMVVDETGLTGTYDFKFFFDTPRPGVSTTQPLAPGLFDALEQQLGLKLVDANQSFDKIVIDHAERSPLEN